MSFRHTWGDPVRPTHLLTMRTCLRCGMVKHTRHEGVEHWSEYHAQDGRLIETQDGRTPPCHAGRMQVAA